MNYRARLTIAWAMTLVFLTSFATADVPQLVNYQGRLQDSDGDPVTTPVTVLFSIWDHPAVGDSLWSEQQNITPDAEGLFSILLGSVSPIPDSAFAGAETYLSIKIEGDSALWPRQRLASVPYAYRAGSGNWNWTLTGNVLYTAGEWGIARAGNILYGTEDRTHVNLGMACTTGTAWQHHRYITVGGGSGNTANGLFAAVGGGENNTASGSSATVPGGSSNVAAGDYSFAAGYTAKANHRGSFVWADHTVPNFGSTGDCQFMARTCGGVWFYTSNDLSTGVRVSTGGSAWSSVSDRNVKRNIRPVDGADILEKLARLEISRWSFKTQDESIEHIGPMAQDFYELFGLGEDDKHISTIDPDGIALATIKELYTRNLAHQKTIDDLCAELAQMKSMLQQLVDKSDNTKGVGYSQ